MEVTYGAREKAIIVAFIKTGELFGEIGFFDHHSRVRTLRAMEDSVIRTWDQESLERMKNREPVLYGAFVTLLARSICAKFRTSCAADSRSGPIINRKVTPAISG